MRTIKPIRLGVLHRVLELGRKPHLIVTVLTATRLRLPGAGQKELIPEFAIWKLVEKSLGTGSILDEGYSKPAGELVVHGHFHAPPSTRADGKAEPVSFVGVEIARDGKKLVDKRLAILGRREWRAGLPTHPEPLTTLRLDWAHAFGGADFAANPSGMGMKPKDASAPWLLPQIEDPKHLIVAPGDRPRPAGFGPLDLGSVERRELAGSYGGDYLETRFPGPAADMDPRFFHTAREDQRIEGFFRGGEQLVFTHMHPTEARLEGVLHPLVGRAFLERGAGTGLVDVPLRIDTLIALPGDDVLVAVHRAMVPVAEDDASDVTTLLIAAEDPSMPRTVAHYQDVMRRRTDREKHGAIWTLQDEDLMPQREAGWGSARMPEDDLTLVAKTDDLQQKRAAAGRRRLVSRKRAELATAGGDPELLPLEDTEAPPPGIEDVGAFVSYLDALPARMEQQQARGEERRRDLEEQGRREAERQGRDWDADLAAVRREASGPPKHPRQMFERMRAQFPEGQRAVFDDPMFIRLAEEQYKQLLEAYRLFAHLRDPAPSLDADASAAVRTRLTEARAASSRSLDDVNATGADLSRLDLSGMDLSSAFLEGADLTETNLEGANLGNAVLARAKLHRTRLSGANLEGANLGDITFTDVDASGANLKRAVLARCRVEKASFAGADLADVSLLESVFGEVDFSRATLPRIAFLKLDLKAARFAGADLEKAQFIECDLTGVDFTEAKLDSATMVKTRLDGACFVRASLIKSAWPSEVTATKVNLSGARIERACLRGVNLQHADLTGATLTQCDLGGADLTDARLLEADARGSLFIRANLTRVNARGASFFEAILTNAILAGADLSKANMFRAILSRARGDDATRFTGAHVEVVLHEPRHDGKTKDVSHG